MSVRSFVLLLVIAVNLFSEEISKSFYSLFFLISIITAISELWNIFRKNKYAHLSNLTG